MKERRPQDNHQEPWKTIPQLTSPNYALTNHDRNATIIGIGGWLLLLIAKLWIGTAVRILGGIAAGFSLLGFFNISFAFFGGIAAYLLGRKKKKGVIVAKIFLAASAGYYLLALLDSTVGGLSQTAEPFTAWFKPSGYLAACILWLLYLARSERVKNTYFARTESVDEDGTATGSVNIAEYEGATKLHIDL